MIEKGFSSMKKKTGIEIICAVIGILGLGGLAFFLTVKCGGGSSESLERAESEATAAVRALYSPGDTDDYIIEETAPETEAEGRLLIWVGDSRTLGMRDAMKNEDVYIGASGEGYPWLAETGLPQLRDAIARYPAAPVVLNFGVNDYDDMELYLKLYESLTEEYQDTRFYFLSVNPIEPTLCKNITNEEIADFNAHLKAAFPDTYLDSFTYLMAEEVATVDGIHYSEEGYQAIYQFAVNQIQTIEKTALPTAASSG